MLSLVCKMAGTHTMKHFNRRCRRNLFVLLLIAVVIGLESSYIMMLDILTDDLVFWIKIYIFYFMKIFEYVIYQHRQSVIINVAASGNRRTITTYFLCETNYSGFSALQFY